MRVMILRDGRPGHFNQSEGLALAFARRRPVEVTRIAVAPRLSLNGHLLRALAKTGLATDTLLKAVLGIDPDAVQRPDLIVSAGAETLVANLLLARRLGVPNVFIGSLRGLPPEAFAAVLTIYPSLSDGDRVILAAKPTPVDPDRLPAPRPIRGPTDLAGARVALLVGGPTPAHLYADTDWRALAGLAAALAAECGAMLRITTSPRTPPAATAALGALAGHPGIETLALYGAPGTPPLDHFFSADAILVSADSATMTFEAVSARRPVVTLDPAARRPARDDEAFAHLAAGGLLERLSLADCRASDVAAALARTVPLAAHPMDLLLDRLAVPLARVGIDVTLRGD